MSQRLEHKGWSIHAYKQIIFPPFGLFTANVWNQDKSRMFNVEANTMESVIAKAKGRVDSKS